MELTYSYWEKKHFFRYDVIVAGSGIVGLNAAIHLKFANPKLHVAVIDRGFLPSGASTKNAGFACFGSISELMEQELLCGTDGLHRLIKKRWSGLQKLRAILGDKALDFQCNGGFEVFKPAERIVAEACASKMPHFNHLVQDIVGEKNAFASSNAKIDLFGFQGMDSMIENKLEAQIDSGMMMTGLIKKATSAGISILNCCTINQIHPVENGVELNTDQGFFSCEKLIVATNAFAKSLLSTLDIVPARGQVVVTSPIADLPFKGTFHYQKGFYYFRNIDGRVLLGGGRNLNLKSEETTSFGETKLIQSALKALLTDVILPGKSFQIEHSWSGIMAFGPQLDPIIEEPLPGVFCAVRCNGMGVAIGCQTGQDVAEKLLETL